jgi:hypothetical protein
MASALAAGIARSGTIPAAGAEHAPDMLNLLILRGHRGAGPRPAAASKAARSNRLESHQSDGSLWVVVDSLLHEPRQLRALSQPVKDRDDLKDIGRYRTGRDAMEVVSGPMQRPECISKPRRHREF